MRFAFFVLVILLHVKVYKHNEAQKFVAECLKNVGMDQCKLQNLFFVKKDTDGIVTIDNTSILLSIHINEEETEMNMLLNKCFLHNQMKLVAETLDCISNIFKDIKNSYLPVVLWF